MLKQLQEDYKTMIEKRRSLRVPIHLTLSICDLYKQDVSGIHHLEAPIDVTDISEHGVGFTSECILPLDYFFHASVNFNDGITYTATLQIIRCDIIDASHYAYGGEFVNPQPDLLKKIHEHVPIRS